MGARVTLHRFYRNCIGTYAALIVILTASLLVVGPLAADRTGLDRQFFPETGFRGTPLLDDVSKGVTLDFLDEDPTLPQRVFSVRWQGFWYLPQATDFELHGVGNDRLDVWIDDELLVRRAPRSDMYQQATTLPLGAGIHRIRAEYEQHEGTHTLQLLWSPPNGRPRPLPSHYLFPERPNENGIRLAKGVEFLRRAVLILWGATLVVIGLVSLAGRTRARYRTGDGAVPANPLPQFRDETLGFALASTGYALIVWLFIKNAWITEDAYIVFRSVEQLFAGNGAVWNPHERVQVFTSPLWFGLLALTRSFSSNLYLNTLVVSFALWLLTVRNLRLLAPNRAAFAVGVLLCLASSALHDYASSGLENVLAYALITTFLHQLVRLQHDSSHPRDPFRNLFLASVALGLTAVTRHDLVPLLLPPAAFLVWTHRSALSARRTLALAGAATLPLAAWTLFSLVYYGFPFPNTAYAKLNTGIDRVDLVIQGLRYIQASLLIDAVTPVVVVAALVVTLFKTSQTAYKFVGLGIAINLFYVVWIGGDFMTGRFLSYSYLVATVVLVVQLPRLRFPISYNLPVDQPVALARWRMPTATTLVGAAVTVYALAYHHTPVNCWPPEHGHDTRPFDVFSERDYYPVTSFTNYLVRDPEQAFWPNHFFARVGSELLHSPERVHVTGSIGMLAYLAGIDKIFIDFHALSDPLLARLPVEDPQNWRVGHFQRAIPDGYFERLAALDLMHPDLRAYGVSDSASELERLTFLSHARPIAPANLNEFYRRLAIVTQTDELWSVERLRTILLFNVGAYDHLLEPAEQPRGDHAP